MLWPPTKTPSSSRNDIPSRNYFPSVLAGNSAQPVMATADCPIRHPPVPPVFAITSGREVGEQFLPRRDNPARLGDFGQEARAGFVVRHSAVISRKVFPALKSTSCRRRREGTFPGSKAGLLYRSNGMGCQSFPSNPREVGSWYCTPKAIPPRHDAK